MNAIKKYRKMAKLKQKDLAELVGLTPSAISHYETGIRVPDINISKRLIRALEIQGVKCSLDQLFADGAVQAHELRPDLPKVFPPLAEHDHVS
ncbi:helix-turn-helix domain-containing protein [Xenorhabdus bovienii]|uniref:helix-turn-helix transcriptional regulator n=1 Tax=Xenorhabdus bovienii TaxID=40576 RepID=UPI00237D1BF6|nr:helix-turn-helix transcriptional regulator [Xenorhabdus bovienii]MDE1488727.1 helix-turn-helix domain-containing protein [Xenorhabdus bovienii]MDE9479703.1 helix-turn-helix domain-containing protein [Xenorhabdus bovienii]MDE9532737.1 helix-turn-helix domain-containing protein [Xenorhabdus bovienii]